MTAHDFSILQRLARRFHRVPPCRLSQRLNGGSLLLAVMLLAAVVPLPSAAVAESFHSPKNPASKWIKISPPTVSTRATAFNNSNYGFQAIVVDSKSGAVYVGTCYQGLWKSSDQGKTWVKVNTGTNGALLDTGRLWSLVIDPVNPKVLYTTAGYGAGGILKSTDGGASWANTIGADASIEKTVQSGDIYSIAMDPANHNHLIASFHGVPSGPYANRSPVLETRDGGATWTVHPAGALSYPQYVYFLNNSSTWLLGTTAGGFWRTTDSGQRWSQVSKQGFSDGGSESYRTARGQWFVAAFGNLLTSKNNGSTWKGVAPQNGAAPYMAIVGDGSHLYTQAAVPGGVPSTRQSYFTSSENDGSHWKRLNTQTFFDGPMDLVYDRARHLIYSSNWRAGVWKFKVRAGSVS